MAIKLDIERNRIGIRMHSYYLVILEKQQYYLLADINYSIIS